MKINQYFVLRQLADTWVVLPLADETINFNGMVTLNESGVLLWKALEEGADQEKLVSMLMSEYIVSEQQARADVDAFIRKLNSIGCLEAQ